MTGGGQLGWCSLLSDCAQEGEGNNLIEKLKNEKNNFGGMKIQKSKNTQWVPPIFHLRQVEDCDLLVCTPWLPISGEQNHVQAAIQLRTK